jgi:hypothetical protein
MNAYARAVALLTGRGAAEVVAAWSAFQVHEAGCLFAHCTPSGAPEPPYKGRLFGDPLDVARGVCVAWTAELTQEVLALGLPSYPHELKAADLRRLADLQRRLDETLRCRAWLQAHAPSLHFYGPPSPSLEP